MEDIKYNTENLPYYHDPDKIQFDIKNDYDSEEEMFEDAESLEEIQQESKKAQQESKKATKNFVCPQCDAVFTTNWSRMRHVNNKHNLDKERHVFVCTFCAQIFHSVTSLRDHRLVHKPTTGFELHDKAFKNTCVVIRKRYGSNIYTLDQAFVADKEDIIKVLSYELLQRNNMKVTVTYHAEFIRDVVNNEDNLDKYDVCLRAPSRHIYNESHILPAIHECRNVCQVRVDDFLENGSGYVTFY